ncbi:hypothetical protein FKM82_030562 [Ascaphus truei]
MITIQITICLLSVLISLVGLVGNGIIFRLLFFRMRRNQSTVYILNLAVADFLYLLGCFMVSLYLLCLYNNVPTSATDDKVFAMFGQLLNNFGFNSSLFLLAALSIERCLAVLYPIWYRCQRPKHLSAIVCGLMWGLSILITLLEKFISAEYKSIYIFTSILYLIIAILMVFSSLFLLVEIQKSAKCCRPRKLYIVIIASIVTFLISLVPVRVMRMLLIFAIIPSGPVKVIIYVVVNLCSAINSSANPYIYIVVGRWRNRASIRVALERVFREEVGSSTQQEEQEASG